MYRPLILACGAALLVAILAFTRVPPEDTAPIDLPERAARQAEFVAPPEPEETVTRGAAPILSVAPQSAPAAFEEPDRADAQIVEDARAGRPTLLPSAAKSEDGTLRASLLTLGPEARAKLTAPRAAPTDLASRVAAAPTQAMHTVRAGDTLFTLALRYYRDGAAKTYLELANDAILKGREPDLGMVLRIPDISDL
ncbi:MAG: LysM peptidoglycan-binding domain-containing protein [Shimia sp.]